MAGISTSREEQGIPSEVLSKVLRRMHLLRRPSYVLQALVARREHRSNARKLRRFRNLHAGERCFVIGNGPSLAIADLERLTGEVTFASNKIYLLFEQTPWRPSYYVAEDDHFIQQHGDDIRRWRGFVKFLNSRWRHLYRHTVLSATRTRPSARRRTRS